MWTRRVEGTLCVLVVYVDDLLLECFTHADRLYDELSTVIPLERYEELEKGNFVGCRYDDSTGDGVWCDQRDYVAMLIARYDEDVAPYRTALTVKRVDVPAIDADGIRPSLADTVRVACTMSRRSTLWAHCTPRGTAGPTSPKQ